MTESERPGPPSYVVSVSRTIALRLGRLQRRASRQGRGEETLAAIKELIRRLQHDAVNVGEPLYRLSKLGLQVRACALRPMAVEFAVHAERRVVFIKGVRLLAL